MKKKTRGKATGKRKMVLTFMVIVEDSHGARIGEEPKKVVITGSDDYELERKKDIACEKMERECTKSKRVTRSVTLANCVAC